MNPTAPITEAKEPLPNCMTCRILPEMFHKGQSSVFFKCLGCGQTTNCWPTAERAETEWRKKNGAKSC